MSRLRAPTARRVPIWRVRLFTLKVASPKMPSALNTSTRPVTVDRVTAMSESPDVAAAACSPDILRSLPTTRFGSRLRSADSVGGHDAIDFDPAWCASMYCVPGPDPPPG